MTAASGSASPVRTNSRVAGAILRPGENCWRVERAHRFRCVQDGEEYFRLVREAILAARESVFVLGWDIDASVELARGVEKGAAPSKLAELLDFVVRRNPDLNVYVLTWDYAALYALERDPTSRIRLGWNTHERVHFQFDDLHPVGASHHQKVVVVDDALAFSGGLDLTNHRWDTTRHEVDDPLRLTTLHKPYTPFHDVQALVSGPAAAALGELARERWRAVRDDTLPPQRGRQPEHENGNDFWPVSEDADLIEVDVAIARTLPAFRQRDAVRECEALFHDQIAAARGTIYVENQYFTNQDLGRALAARLREPDGPEIVFVGPRDCSGWLEQKTMGVLRHVVLVELLDADLHGRLRILFPYASKSREVCTFVHSKILVIDDEHLRIGSANLSNRSMGMDTECDLVAFAGGDAKQRTGIRRVRDRLVAEHLGVDAERVTEAVERLGSLRAAVDELAVGDHTLARVEVDRSKDGESPGALALAADPTEPMSVSRTIDRLMPALERDDRANVARALFLAACAAGVAAIVARGYSGTSGFEAQNAQQLLAAISADQGALPWILVGLVAGGLLFVPFELLVLVPVVLLGAVRGGFMAVVAGLVCALIGYAIGRILGPRPFAPLLGRRAQGVWRGLRRDGAVSVAVVRFVALFSATSVHVLCGAAKVSPRDFALGSLLGLAPAWLASIALGSLLRAAILEPSMTKTVITILAAIGLALLLLYVRRNVLMRAVGAADRDQEERSRYG